MYLLHLCQNTLLATKKKSTIKGTQQGSKEKHLVVLNMTSNRKDKSPQSGTIFLIKAYVFKTDKLESME